METVHPLVAHSSVALPGAFDSIFEPDAITPQQWRDQWHQRSEPDPEHQLVWAVLEDAIRCAKRPLKTVDAHHRWNRTIGAEAELWFESDNTQPFSFLWCCDVLGQDPEAIRKGLTAMSLRKIGRRRPNVRYSQLSIDRERSTSHT